MFRSYRKSSDQTFVGKTSRNVFHHKIDYAPATVSTRYGILGVKVRISSSWRSGNGQKSISLEDSIIYVGSS